MPALLDPVPDAWRSTLRRAVLDHALGEHRRRHPALLHVGRPGGVETLLAAGTEDVGDGPTDHALRVDVVAAALRRVRREQERRRLEAAAPLLWLTRPGDLDLQDVDARWLAAALTAGAEAATDVTMVVVNRHGWRDPRTGCGQHWARLRRR